MTLEEFKAHLIEIYTLAGFTEVGIFNSNARQIAENKFEYDFDGYILCETEFLSDGSVKEIVDLSAPNEYTSIEEWKYTLVSQMED